MSANTSKNAELSTSMDWLKYALSALLVIGGLFVFYWFSDLDGSLRGAALFLTIVASGLLFMFTGKGRRVRHFMEEARFELRKVVWPTKDMTIRATGMIIVVVLICSLIMWVFDFLIANGIALILGS